MGNEDERQARPRGLAFIAKSQLMTSDDVARALWRMAHEIVERNHSVASLSIIGLQTGGKAPAAALASILAEISGQDVNDGTLDVSFYRDDLSRNPIPTSSATHIDHDLTERTIRAALNALSDWGRPRAVQLAVLVDRGHRELPIRPDYVGKNLPTSLDEAIVATLDGVWIGTREAT
jgi:pyrimidine operon attenuation protein/uracil phosphoribosyltransferase